MATVTMSTHAGLLATTDKGWTPVAAPTGLNASDYAAMQNLSTLDAALAAADAAYWTQVRLDSTNIWDKLYWLRVNRAGTAALT